MSDAFSAESDQELLTAATRLLPPDITAAEAHEMRITRTEGGGNNRAYRLDLSGRLPLLLKAYFHHPDDPRDRLRAEFEFLQYAWNAGIRSIPAPIASDPERHLGLYEFVAGARPASGHLDTLYVDAALRFFQEINVQRLSPAAQALGDASEACFSITAHLARVERRVEALGSVSVEAEIDHTAKEFVEGELRPRWQKVRQDASEALLGAGDDGELLVTDRRISPSDFGFHNCLVDGEGSCRFIDFEYAGWDDPAKTVCDFFCQPAVPVPLRYFEHFSEAIARDLENPAIGLRRMQALLPVYRLKWCCIMLNDFLPVGGSRRRHALPAADVLARKTTQLKAARAMLVR